MDFREYLKAKVRERGISLHRLALLCDLNQIYFYQAVNKNKENPPPWVLRRAAPHLGVGYVELLIQAGYLREEDVSPGFGGHNSGVSSTHSYAYHLSGLLRRAGGFQRRQRKRDQICLPQDRP